MEYKRFGVMLDCSRKAVMKISTLKKYVDYLVKIGYNALELYTEDTFKVENEPYFGHMRGAYTVEEIKELDEYCISKGVELIPCVQTLAHLETIFRWEEYGHICDADDVLLIGDERTYTLIENIFSTLAKSFTSRNVNIGMDEAELAGLGRYLILNGYKNRFEILSNHLKRIVEIAGKYGFKPHMWSDMFFKLITGGNYYAKGIKVSEEVKNSVPKEIALAYWDYMTDDGELYDEMFRAHKEFDRDIWFVGGVWMWRSFAPLNDYALNAMKGAVKAVKKHKIENVLFALWKDDGAECSFFSVLPVLYTIRQYANGNFDIESIKAGFKAQTGLNYDEIKLIGDINKTKGADKENWKDAQRTRLVLYNDPFIGSVDALAKDIVNNDYLRLAKEYEKIEKKGGELAYLFSVVKDLALVLDKKVPLGLNTRKAYQEKDIKALKALIKDYDKTIALTKKLYKSFKTLWDKENKPFGFETHDTRFGGLIFRLEKCRERLELFVKGKISVIEELEETMLEKPVRFWRYNTLFLGGI